MNVEHGKLAYFGGDVWGSDEGFADQDGVDADFLQAGHVGGGEDAGFGDDGDVRGNQRAQAFGGGERDFEGGQVAVVDAD